MKLSNEIQSFVNYSKCKIKQELRRFYQRKRGKNWKFTFKWRNRNANQACNCRLTWEKNLWQFHKHFFIS